MLNIGVAEVVVLLLPLLVTLLALYWVVRLGVAAGIRSALPNLVIDASSNDRG